MKDVGETFCVGLAIGDFVGLDFEQEQEKIIGGAYLEDNNLNDLLGEILHAILRS